MRGTHWHVLGAGAIGCLFGAALHQTDCRITLVLRRGATRTSVPLVVEQQSFRFEAQLPATSSEARGHISHLLVSTKACDVCPAVADIAHRLDNSSQVLLMVNGLGFADELRRAYPWLNLYSGTTTEGAYRMAPWHIRHAGRGQTRIGQAGLICPPDWFENWSRAMENCLWDEDITSALWLKLAINCAINPLTALHGCRNGELAQRPELASEVAHLCREIARISSAAGFNDIAAKLPRAVADVIAGTALNRSSMLQDVQGGRRTEIDYITGHLLRVAEHYGIEAPHNSALLHSVLNIAR